MAEAKKDDKKDPKKDAKKPSSGGGDSAMESEIIFWILIGAMILFIILPALLNFFNVGFNFNNADSTSVTGIGNTFANLIDVLSHAFSSLVATVTTLSLFFILIFALAVFYAKFKLNIVKDEYTAKSNQTSKVHYVATGMDSAVSVHSILPGIDRQGAQGAPMVLPVNPRWKNIEQNMISSNSSDWRLGILEADIILYDMLDQMGYSGQSIADKLKQVNPQSFTTLNDAWKAHKIRNIIAHEGASYNLSRSEAERTIGLYKKVFDEFYFV